MELSFAGKRFPTKASLLAAEKAIRDGPVRRLDGEEAALVMAFWALAA